MHGNLCVGRRGRHYTAISFIGTYLENETNNFFFLRIKFNTISILLPPMNWGEKSTGPHNIKHFTGNIQNDYITHLFASICQVSISSVKFFM